MSDELDDENARTLAQLPPATREYLERREARLVAQLLVPRSKRARFGGVVGRVILDEVTAPQPKPRLIGGAIPADVWHEYQRLLADDVLAARQYLDDAFANAEPEAKP